MKRFSALLLAAFCALPLSGCMQSEQVESQAYVILLGVDAAPEGMEISVQVPKATGAAGDTGGEQGNAPYLLASARGRTWSEASQALQSVVQRKLNFRQTILVILSEELARGDSLPEIMRDMFESYALDSSAWFAICQGSAREFVAAQKPVIGTRVSTAVSSMLENYVSVGLIPSSTFADTYYAMNSGFSDPAVIYASVGDPKADAGRTSSSGEDESEAETVFGGAALLRDGRMIGILTAEEVCCLDLLRSRPKRFILLVDGSGAPLVMDSRPGISVDLSGDAPAIRVSLRLTMERSAAFPTADGVREALLERLNRLTERCRELGVEPFGFAERAVRSFLTLESWNRYGWRERFSRADVTYDISIRARSPA